MIKKSISIAVYSIRKWFSNPRYSILFIMLFILTWTTLNPVKNFCTYTGVRTNPLLFVFYSCNFIHQLLFMSGIIFLFSNAPFMDECELYVIQRSGRKSWVIGQILYIFMSSAIYFLILILMSILILAPYSTFGTDGWGKVINTLSQTNAAGQVNLGFMVPYKIIRLYSPFQAIFLCFIFEWLAASIIGMAMFCVNLLFKESLGIVIGSIVVGLDLLITNALPYTLYRFSPVSIGRLSIIDPSKTYFYPSILDGLILDGILLIILCVISIISMRKNAIDVKYDI